MNVSPDTETVMGLVVGETFLYLAGLYLAALASIRLASRYLVTEYKSIVDSKLHSSKVQFCTLLQQGSSGTPR